MAARIVAFTSSELMALRVTLKIILKGGKPELSPEHLGALENIYTEINRPTAPGERKNHYGIKR